MNNIDSIFEEYTKQCLEANEQLSEFLIQKYNALKEANPSLEFNYDSLLNLTAEEEESLTPAMHKAYRWAWDGKIEREHEAYYESLSPEEKEKLRLEEEQREAEYSAFHEAREALLTEKLGTYKTEFKETLGEMLEGYSLEELEPVITLFKKHFVKE